MSQLAPQAIPGVPSATLKSIKKNVPTLLTAFVSEFEEMLSKSNNQKQRQQKIEHICGKLLGFDCHMLEEIEQHIQESASFDRRQSTPTTSSPILLLDRDELVERSLVHS